MIRDMKRRFIKYNILVISCSILILAIAVSLGSNTDIPLSRWLFSGILALVIVYISSVLISNIAIAPIREAWKRQLDFTADASHELRTPLSVIQSNLELVMDNPKETVADQQRWLENALSETQRMSKIVNDLLMLSRADSEAAAMKYETFDFTELIEDVIYSFIPAAEKKGIILRNDIADQIVVYGSYDYLKQLVIILTDNAIKYMEGSGYIDITLEIKNTQIVLKIADTGPGIPEEDLAHVFERFYRVDKARTRNVEGTGLGLSIAKWIVESHKGTINMESMPGTGTEVTVLLPAETLAIIDCFNIL